MKTEKLLGEILLAVLLVMCMAAVFAFAACGNSDDGKTEGQTDNQTDESGDNGSVSGNVGSETIYTYTSYTSVPYVEGGTSSQVMDVYVPDTESDAKMPLIVCMHGGMFMFGDTDMSTVSPVYEYLAPRGYVCASIQYTMGAGTYPAAVKDCKTAVQYLVDNADTYKIDTTKIITWGESAGSYLACLTALSGPSDYKMNDADSDYTFEVTAYVDFYGPIMCGNGETDSGVTSWLGSASAPDLSEYLEATTVRYIWIQHGGADTSVSNSHASSFKTLVEATGNYSESDGTLYYEIIAGANHMGSEFFTDSNLSKLCTWLNAALGV